MVGWGGEGRGGVASDQNGMNGGHDGFDSQSGLLECHCAKMITLKLHVEGRSFINK